VRWRQAGQQVLDRLWADNRQLDLETTDRLPCLIHHHLTSVLKSPTHPGEIPDSPR
jgi:hypothetical protein